jgi:adenosylcobinamide-phosphate synthase
MALGLLAGAVLDRVVPDPRRWHPVAAFGSVALWAERRLYRDSRLRGVGHAAGLAGAAVGLGVTGARRRGLPLLAMTILATWTVLGGRSLTSEASAVAERLNRGELAAARQRLTHLVGRRVDELDEHEIARAVIESVAENTSDAAVAPLFWGAVLGLPGLLGYRAVNTLDAMVGHHSPRYERFGWASARADDVANFVPARLTAGLSALLAPVVGGRASRVVGVVRTDGRRHPSPNSGMAEAAFAGALGVRLGGRNDYGSRIEDRPVLGGDGRAAGRDDIARAARLSRSVVLVAAVLCAGGRLLGTGRR